MRAHIVWDWNGTLLNDNHAVLAGVNSICRSFSRDEIDLDYWRSVFSRPLKACYEQLLGRTLSDEEWSGTDALYHGSYNELLPTCALAEDAEQVLRDWQSAGNSQSLLSMWFHEPLTEMVTRLELVQYFSQVDGLRGTVGGGSKAKYLSEHLVRTGMDPASVVLIGDVVDDAFAAESVGARCVLVTTGMTSHQKLADTGHPVADSLAAAVRLIEDRAS
ncbi:HAD family hydrolase [Actinoalloteichus hymeniacidonis]|uniref:Phosphatase n=1 Tax=Actinoalloteichus hymeniacidonis TaxID=340345 RepID=A0AAC9HNR2_9PSEU|nr:HAD hydrolase-like protein [Actinoalloteichus hymeniacidonis]AOS62513.1 putative phosphatase [Actinoalloteichus hymeniacidonis]MBB5909456.1 phosphoglycolate phosphatase-like HAD superfamily hydrolase [Actinoalloteichus hymeniacidonis]